MARFDSLEAWLAWQEQLHPRPIDLGLERVAAVYKMLKSERKKIITITVAGTNGKGSCIAYLEGIYRAQGYRVGAYTSPHILRYNERIRINGVSASDEMICQAFNRIEQVRAETSLSYFEFGTLAALAIFADAELDVQLLEVGMGGRLDAVNMIEPDATIITTIAIDHVDWLGNTLESIGREKAGIFRAGVPAIVGDENPPLSVLSSAKEKNAQLFQFGQHFNYQKQGELWTWFSDELSLQNLPLPIFKGEHQYRNASAIIMTVMQLQSVISVTDQAIRSGLQQAELKGRFQFISGDKPVLLDVGHNPQAVQTLVDYLRLSFPLIKIHAVFAMMKDKDIVSVISLMRDYVHEWYLAPLKNPRAASEEVLLNYFLQQQINAVHSGFTDFSSTFTAAQNNAAEGELILVFGSFFLVSEYLSKFA